MNRKQKAIEEKFRATPNREDDKPFKIKQKYFAPKPDPFREKVYKLVELFKKKDIVIWGDAKREAAYQLSAAQKFKTLEEWNNNVAVFYGFPFGNTKPSPPTLTMKLTWDVHTGLAFTKLYNSLQ